MFTEREASDLPWDFATTISQRQWRDHVVRRVEWEKEFPPPTPRTKASATGMKMWEDWIKGEREAKATAHENGDEYGTIRERYPLVVRDAYLAFDHKVYAKWGELVYWHKRLLKPLRENEVHIVRNGNPTYNAPEKPKATHSEMTFYG